MPNGLIPSAGVDSITIGGRVFTDTRNLIVLIAKASSAGGTCTFRKVGSTTAYTPSGAKSFRALAMKVRTFSAAANQVNIAQSDNDVGFDGVTALTNGVYAAGSATAYITYTGATIGATDEAPINFVVANTKYLTMLSQNGNTIMMVVGYEE